MTHRARRAYIGGLPMRWLEANGGSPGPPIVLLHGIPTSPELWRHVIPLLEGHRVLAWEMVGYGDSIPAGVHRDLSVARQAGYLLAWLDHLGIDRALLVGHDLGGGVAQIAAVRRPGLCTGLVLTNAIAYDSWPVLPMRLLRAGRLLLGHLPAAIWRPAFHRAIVALHGSAEVGKESARIHWGHYASHGGGEALVRQARWLDAADTLAVADGVRRLDLPARVVWGDADPFLTIGHGARLATDLGTAVRAIPGGLHFTPEDHPGPVASAIRELSG